MTVTSLIPEIRQYLERLFPLNRSLTGEANRQTLSILRELIPLSVHEVPSGTPVYDWIVPDEWAIRGAWISDSHGRRLIDWAESNLHVASYSIPVNETMDWSALEPRLQVHPELPDAIPYRTLYYNRDWSFCVTRGQYETIRVADGPFEVVIDSELKPGSMTLGEFVLQGRSSEEILISCYICHPSMANDSLSGVILAAFLARELSRRGDLKYTYRFVFVPETIGAIAYCAFHESEIKKVDIGLVITTVGGPGLFGYKKSFDPTHPINRLVEETFHDAGVGHITYPFDIHGSDERQYSSQGFRVNTITICKDRYYEYPEYHSSLDNLDFVKADAITASLDLYLRLIDKLENRVIYRNRIPCCEVMLSRHDLYPARGGAQRPELGGRSELDLILWLLFLSDGRRSIDDVAHELNVGAKSLRPIADKLLKKGVLELV
ncbi:MAG: DUF4910 domain-containing protein [bacterium]|nr:DUF4910 domain-containing protein [bacterium]